MGLLFFGFFFARVGIAHEERGKPCRQSTLRLTERENTAPLRFSDSDVPAFSSEVISQFVYSLLNRDLVFLGVFFVVVYLQTSPNIYKLGNTTEVLEERTALASIHARSTPEYL